jgi:hypothetical protein
MIFWARPPAARTAETGANEREPQAFHDLARARRGGLTGDPSRAAPGAQQRARPCPRGRAAATPARSALAPQTGECVVTLNFFGVCQGRAGHRRSPRLAAAPAPARRERAQPRPRREAGAVALEFCGRRVVRRRERARARHRDGDHARARRGGHGGARARDTDAARRGHAERRGDGGEPLGAQAAPAWGVGEFGGLGAGLGVGPRGGRRCRGLRRGA